MQTSQTGILSFKDKGAKLFYALADPPPSSDLIQQNQNFIYAEYSLPEDGRRFCFLNPFRKGNLRRKKITAFGMSDCVCEDLSVSDGQIGLKSYPVMILTYKCPGFQSFSRDRGICGVGCEHK
jgi:hypothetical protein